MFSVLSAIKNAPVSICLRRVLELTLAVPLNLRRCCTATSSESVNSYALTRHTREKPTGACVRFSGSEGMGPGHASLRFSPTTGSLCWSNVRPSSSQPLSFISLCEMQYNAAFWKCQAIFSSYCKKSMTKVIQYSQIKKNEKKEAVSAGRQLPVFAVVGSDYLTTALQSLSVATMP